LRSRPRPRSCWRTADSIQREIEDALSEKILYGELTAGQIIVVDVDEAEGAAQKFTFRGEAKPIDLPDTPPVALSGAEGGKDDEGPAAQAE
jgi:ATP-dependent Clp protease ATP-binding subunit ClpC